MLSLRSVCLCVCCPSDNWKSCERILAKSLGGVGHGPGTNEFNFGDDLDHRPDPGVRSPKSAFTGFSRKLPTDFDEILQRAGVWSTLETNWLHFGDNPHHYPDPGVRSGKNCHVVNTHRTDSLSAAPISSILVTVRITVRIQESEVRNPDSLDYPLCWRSAEDFVLWALV